MDRRYVTDRLLGNWIRGAAILGIDKDKTIVRRRFPAPPEGTGTLRWYGPGLLWMLSAVGTGSVLFTPRVASVYQYELLWLLLLVVFFMWVMIREMSRYSIVTGQTMLEGMDTLAGPKGWAVWVILLPQLVAAAVGIAGLAAVVGSALSAFFPGGNNVYAVGLLVFCTAFTASGRYSLIERISRFMALALMVMAVVSAVVIFPDTDSVVQGLTPGWPDDPDYYVILPWVGTILAGSMGIVWFGYWTATRGFGGGLTSREPEDETPDDVRQEQQRSELDADARARRVERARAWTGVMTGAATLGVVGGLIVIFAFLVLGAELLAPKGILPEGPDVAVDLARLFSEVWGQPGKYLLLAAVIVALGGSVLANQDGWGRSFADMTLILMRENEQRRGWVVRSLQWVSRRTNLPLLRRRYLKRLYIISVTGIIPLGILLAFSDPVKVMSASGIVAAAHTPFIVLISLYVNRTRLPAGLRPGLFFAGCMTLAGLFYLGFAVIYVLDLAGLMGG